MTAYRFVTLTCDRCGDIYDNGQAKTITAAREGSWSEGWRYEHRRDICRRCMVESKAFAGANERAYQAERAANQQVRGDR